MITINYLTRKLFKENYIFLSIKVKLFMNNTSLLGQLVHHDDDDDDDDDDYRVSLLAAEPNWKHFCKV